MKKILVLLIIVGIFTVSVLYRDEISDFLNKNVIEKLENKKSDKLKNNTYANDKDYKFVQTTKDFTPKNKKELLNIYYTVMASGMNEFTFYCSNDYDDCIEDVDYISNNQKLLSHVNNFVPVFNAFKNIETNFDNRGKVTITIKHLYDDKKIDAINKKIDEITKEIITPDMNDEAKIKAVHDYIINHTKYDKDKSDNNITNYDSNTAYGALIEGYAICGGYADSMKLFLDKFGIPNFKITSENHIWNVVYVNNDWYNLDLTWDDPVTSTGEDVLDYSYFLITTDELFDLEKEQHIFDDDIYLELKEKEHS